MTEQEIASKYEELCMTESDIWKHLPILKEYADKCESVTECGVRGCVSLFAFLASKASKVVAIDIFNVWTPEVSKLQFICANDLEIEIEPTDMLHIDTAHNYTQCIKELNLHAKNVKKFICFHDVASGTFGVNGDDGGKGLMYAINEFLEANKEWKVVYETDINNGMLIIERQ